MRRGAWAAHGASSTGPIPRPPGARGRATRLPARPPRDPRRVTSWPAFLPLESRASNPLRPPGMLTRSAHRWSRTRSRFQRREAAEARSPICGAACHGADPTPADHAIQPRPTVGGHGIGGSRTLEHRGRAARRPAKPRRGRCGHQPGRVLALVVPAQYPAGGAAQIGHVRAPLVEDQLEAGARCGC